MRDSHSTNEYEEGERAAETNMRVTIGTKMRNSEGGNEYEKVTATEISKRYENEK